MKVIQALLICLSLAWAQIQPLCGNSPLNYTQLQGILAKALERLALLDLILPNLDPPFQPKCDQINHPQTCGYPFLFTNGSTSDVVGFNNPGSVYGLPLTNLSLLPAIIETGAPSRELTPNDVTFSLGGHEAVIWLGCTAPGGLYFSFSKNIYSAGDSTNLANRRYGVLGDTLNEVTLNVSAVNNATKFGAATLIIYVADTGTRDKIQDAFAAAGFAKAFHNVQAWPTAMVKLGTNPKTDANLLLGARVYGLNPELFVAYQQLVGHNQPFVRLTPKVSLLPVNPINPIFSWIPDYTNFTVALSTSELGYSPYVDQVIQATVAKFLAALPTGWVGVPVRPFKDEDDGSKWIFQQSNQGLLFDRDADYLIYSPQLSIDYTQGGFTVAFGVRHESTAWHTKLPNPAVPNIAQTPAPGNHAVYWNIAFNSLSGDLQAQGGFDSTINTAAFNPGPAADPLGVIWAYGFGTATGCATLEHLSGSTIGCNVALSTYTGGILLPIGRAYVNPLTGVYPSPATILPATIVHFSKRS